jgi:hypothetical protein
MNPDHAMFILVMGRIRAHQGDPPTMPGMEQLAVNVFRGQMDPVDAMIALAPPPAQQQFMAVVPMLKMTGMYQFVRLEAVIAAAYSLPRAQIPVFLPGVEGKSHP